MLLITPRLKTAKGYKTKRSKEVVTTDILVYMIAVDVETSGLDPRTASILSIGAVDTDKPTNQFYGECVVWEGAFISDEALEINGFVRAEIDPILGSEAFLAKKSEKELIAEFITWAINGPAHRTLVAQTPSFDRDFIRAACDRAGLTFPFAARTLDTHSLCWLHMTQQGIHPPELKQRSSLSLDDVLEYCGIAEEPKPHNALTGALSHAEVFSRIAYTKKLLPTFISYDIPWQTT
jgi:DNA polymerase III epsilon subunit-like protein